MCLNEIMDVMYSNDVGTYASCQVYGVRVKV